MFVEVFNNDVTGALRQLKRRMKREGLFTDMRKHEAHEKPSERRQRQEREARRRVRKQAERKARAEQRPAFEPHHAPGAHYGR